MGIAIIAVMWPYHGWVDLAPVAEEMKDPERNVPLGLGLGLGIVAEGVENEAQRDFLLRLGVNVGQGFLFAPGLLPGEFAKRVAAQQDAT